VWGSGLGPGAVSDGRVGVSVHQLAQLIDKQSARRLIAWRMIANEIFDSPL